MVLLFIDFIIQSGEFSSNDGNWLLDLLNAIIGAGIGSGVTVWALFRTFRQDKVKEEVKRIQFKNEKLKYLQSLIKIIIRDLKVQSEKYKEFSDKIQNNPLELPQLIQLPINDLNRIVNKLNLEDYYHSYLGQFGDNQDSIDEFRKLISLLDYFNEFIILNKNSLQNAVDFDYERKVKLKNLVEKSMDDTGGFIINKDLEKNHNNFVEFLNSTIATFHQNRKGRSDLKYFQENFIEVMLNGLMTFAPNISQAHYLIIKMKEATFIYNDILNHNKDLSSEFEASHVELNTYIEKIEEIAKRLIESNIE